jgi:hypothetical protein
MLTLRRLAALAESYGADLRRWPPEQRDAAEALLADSAEARAVLETARTLDEAVAAASAHADAVLLRPGEQDAALARLRAGVEARIAAAATPRRKGMRLAGIGQWLVGLDLRRAGVAAAGAGAIVAGFLIGGLSAAPPAPDSVLTTLQPAPILMLAD